MSISLPEWFYKEYIEPYKGNNYSDYIQSMILKGILSDNIAVQEQAGRIKALADKIAEQQKLIELLQFKLQHNLRR